MPKTQGVRLIELRYDKHGLEKQRNKDLNKSNHYNNIRGRCMEIEHCMVSLKIGSPRCVACLEFCPQIRYKKFRKQF